MKKIFRIKRYLLIVLPVIMLIFVTTTRVNAAPAPSSPTTTTTIGANITTTGLLTVGGNGTFTGAISTGKSYQIGGTDVLVASTTTRNLFIGFEAGINTGTGSTSAFSRTSPTDNTFLGYLTGQANTSGYSNTAVGSYALQVNTSGYGNTASGYSALSSNTTGANNTASGSGALSVNTTGQWNTALGEGAGYTNGNGTSNADTFIGAETSYNSASDFASTTEIGYQSGYNNNGSLNTLIGYKSGYNITSGANNIIIGANINAPAISSSPSNNQQLNIGNLLYGNGIYNGSTPSSAPVIGNIGIGTSTPNVPLQVTTAATNATTTVEFGKKGQTKGTCLKMYDDTGAVQYVSIHAGAFVISATSCQ